MKIAILTSSRADFGIYLPLLLALKKQQNIPFDIIAFGTHLSHFHGFTIQDILDQGFEVKHRIESVISGDSQGAISTSIGLTIIKFADFWSQHHSEYTTVLCLGDRYEMFAAVTAGIPFNIQFAHLHGGETTLGAIDNIFRHAITHASSLHFTSTELFAERVKELTGKSDNVYNVGALSLDNLIKPQFYSKKEFKEKWNIDLDKKIILVTFHPETVTPGLNEKHARELTSALKQLDSYLIVVTMPNADTSGNILRAIIHKELKTCEHVIFIENFGTKGYFTIMKNCCLLLGNTSSGIIEAASFNKYVINLGDRQKGRLAGGNVLHSPISAAAILEKVVEVGKLPPFTEGNIYWNGGAANMIIQHLETRFKSK